MEGTEDWPAVETSPAVRRMQPTHRKCEENVKIGLQGKGGGRERRKGKSKWEKGGRNAERKYVDAIGTIGQ